MSTCSVTFFPSGLWFPTQLFLSKCPMSLPFLFLFLSFPTADFNFLLLYYLFHFHPQPLALTNAPFQSSLPVPLFPQPAIGVSTIFNLASHPMLHTLFPRAVPWSPLSSNAILTSWFMNKSDAFFQISWAQQEGSYPAYRSEKASKIQNLDLAQ